MIFNNFKFEITLHLKSLQILDKMAKLGKSNQDAHNPGKWLILEALLKNGVAEVVASDSHDTNPHQKNAANGVLFNGFKNDFILLW